MKRLCLIALLSTSLAGCQATSSVPQSGAGTSASLARALNMRAGSPDLDNDCFETIAFFAHQNGGRIGLPSANGNYYGKIFYASGLFGDGQTVLAVCPGSDNNFQMPIPKGYTADWFAQWSFSFAATFGQDDLYGKMYSTLWLPRTDYYMYIYDQTNKEIESYELGRANLKSGFLTFPSPFENGFSTPLDGVLNFEIVHKTK
jgi:hypothetical protein